MTSAELVAILVAKGVDASLEDLAACPGSYETPFASVTLPDGSLLSVIQSSDEGTLPDEPYEGLLHLQTGPGYDSDGCFIVDFDYDNMLIWHDVTEREALSIMETFGRKIAQPA